MNKVMHLWFVALVTATCISSIGTPSIAATRDFAVEVSATAQESPPQIDFSWVADTSATEYRIFKKAIADTIWTGPIAVLGGDAVSFTDTDITIGEAYEYSFRKTQGIISDTVEVASSTPVTFTIQDSWGDGICCDQSLGSYKVTGCGAVYASGGAFGTSEATSFTVGSPEHPCSALVIDITLDVFGQETTWQVTEDVTGDTLAQGGPYSPPRFGHILAGIGYAAPEAWGTVLLLVDEPVADSLAPELARLEIDLIRDGYLVCRRDVPDDTPVPVVKDLIVTECQNDPTITTVFLFGNIAVPYSGDIHGAHANHHGAWPADLYYGELDGSWTDSMVNNTSATRPENHNVPGDGKFDQTYLPSDVDLQVGRVDLSRMPSFAESEVGLLRRYLDKDHAYRTGGFAIPRRGRIDDNVGEAYGIAYACNGWRNYTAMFGSPAVRAGNWLPGLETNPYLFAYGCGPGSYSSCGGVVTTGDFATRTIYAVFTMLMGSYFGDWDNYDNLMRAALGSAGYPLTCCWAGRPAWHLHHMALGYPIGYATRLTQNNHTLYTIAYGGMQIHTALMGDPTLRLHPFKPPSDFHVENLPEGGVLLSWSAPEDTVMGYNVYRTGSIAGGFTRLNSTAIEDTTYIDTSPPACSEIYMVRAVRLETTGSGTYFNLSPGIIDSVEVPAALDIAPQGVPLEDALLMNAPNPCFGTTTISCDLAGPSRVVLRIHDITGRLVRTIDNGWCPAGSHTLKWDGKDMQGRRVASGVYFISVMTDRTTLSSKLVRLE